MLEVIKIDNYSVDMRIDKWIKINLSKIPQSLVEKDLRKGKIKVNQHKVKSSYKLKKEDKYQKNNISEALKLFKTMLPEYQLNEKT